MEIRIRSSMVTDNDSPYWNDYLLQEKKVVLTGLIATIKECTETADTTGMEI